MKHLFIALALAGTVSAQSALEKAEQDLRLAQSQLKTLETQITKEEGDLIRVVEEIDDKVLKQHKSLAKLLKDEDALSGAQRKLNNELSSRKGEFEFTLNLLRSYASGVKNRIHPSEKQSFGEDFEGKRKLADETVDNLPLEIQRRLNLLRLTADRLTKVSGGIRSDGKAFTEDRIAKEGKFAVAGPLGYFASNDGELLGFTAYAAESSDYPNISPLREGGENISALVNNGTATVAVDATMGKAVQVARTKKTVKDYLKGGGVVGYGILGLGVVALLIALLKVIEINTFPIPKRKKLNLIIDDLLNHDTGAAKLKASKIKGLGGKMVSSGVEYFYDKRRILEDALLEKLGMIQPKLERSLPFLALVAAAAPMMGLLGTVLGIMKTFAMMSAGGGGDSKSFSAGISEALITTAMGLIVAIPVIIIHGMLKSLAKSKFGQAEGVALSILNGTTELETDNTNNPSDPDSDDESESDDETDLLTA